MFRSRRRQSTTVAALGLAAAIAYGARAQAQETVPAESFILSEVAVDDFKAVYATVRSHDRIEARVRTPGTIATLKIAVGAEVKAGETLAEVTDPKIALSIQALDARIVGLNSRVATTRIEFDRAKKLAGQGITPKARLDEAKLAYDVAVNDLKAAEAERSVLQRQIEEGAVLAPATGRVLTVPVTEGSVVMAGESIATIAANGFLLRLELPERHALSMQSGDTVRLGTRGRTAAQTTITQGRIVRVYPELQSGRVIADAEVDSLGDYFIGERARVWISAGHRQTLVVPTSLIVHRFGLDLVRIESADGQPIEVVVQLGQPTALADGADGVEVLAGLKAGDRVLAVEAAYE
jgi:RND family efflux transporter MFP subunit